MVFKSPVKINKNFCFQNSDDSASKFCLSKNSFTHDYLMMENVLNMLGVDMNTYNDISQLEYIIRLNAQKIRLRQINLNMITLKKVTILIIF